MTETWFGLENRNKISQIFNDYLNLTFFLLFILWFNLEQDRSPSVNCMICETVQETKSKGGMIVASNVEREAEILANRRFDPPFRMEKIRGEGGVICGLI